MHIIDRKLTELGIKGLEECKCANHSSLILKGLPSVQINVLVSIHSYSQHMAVVWMSAFPLAGLAMSDAPEYLINLSISVSLQSRVQADARNGVQGC